MNRGILYALSAYIFWGLHPIYWKQLQHVPPSEILAHRIVWSFLVLFILMTFRRGWRDFILKLKVCRSPLLIGVPAILIGSNWGVYIWAVNAGYIIETSLGYFISPLLTVFLGVIFLHEHLRRVQWLAIGIAGTGVIVMTVLYGQFPWISLYLAGTWGAYGLLRKQSPLSPIEGLTLETVLLFVPGVIFLSGLKMTGSFSFFSNWQTGMLLAGTGLISAFPLLVFIAGARLINLSLIGFLQYIYPTLIFMIGFLLYKEPLNRIKLIGFLFIWSALLLYSIEGWLNFRTKK